MIEIDISQVIIMAACIVCGFLVGLFTSIYKNDYIWVPVKKLEDGTTQFGTLIKGYNGIVIGLIVSWTYFLGIMELVFPVLPVDWTVPTGLNLWLPLLITAIAILIGISAPDIISPSDKAEIKKIGKQIVEVIKTLPDEPPELAEQLKQQPPVTPVVNKTKVAGVA